MNYANQVEEIGNLFSISTPTTEHKNKDMWYIDSVCRNHMTSREDLLVEINRNVKAKVQVGIGVLVDVVGKGSLVIKTMRGKKYIRE